MRVERIRGDILGRVVDAPSGHPLIMIRPVRCEDFERFSAQKEIKGFTHFLIQELVQKFIKIASLPSAVGESTAGVLPRPTGSLDNAIDRDKAQENQFSHGCSFLSLFFDAGILTCICVDIALNAQANDSRKPRGLSSTERWNQGVYGGLFRGFSS